MAESRYQCERPGIGPHRQRRGAPLVICLCRAVTLPPGFSLVPADATVTDHPGASPSAVVASASQCVGYVFC
jgi:hypothetical protein